MMIIDAEDQVVGRIATRAAKAALLGEQVRILNSEKAVMTGKPKSVLERFEQKRNHGAPLVGPYYPRNPDRILKRIIRGMLPYKKSRGRDALKRVKCYVGVPEEYAGKDAIKYEAAHLDKLSTTKYVRLGEISKLIGGKRI
ncbi:50S ribosomal protein L13 [Candidatus Woesearchaeota archaeon]|nr:50S ribosomal protein L13 [Candidatus Woesearchaeota archaeon]